MRYLKTYSPGKLEAWLRAGIAIVLIAWQASLSAQPPFTVEIQINDTADKRDDYVTWAPTIARVRLVKGVNPGKGGIVQVRVINDDPTAIPTGGDLVFAAYREPWPANTTATQDSLRLRLPRSGAWVRFMVAGKFGRSSANDKDAHIVVRLAESPHILGRHELMVRVRKNAEKLSIEERTRFLTALRALYDQGGFLGYQDMHSIASQEAHGGAAFLPWHRVLVLRLERALQAIDPSVALHYWRFDEAAPTLFSADWIGANDVLSSPAPVIFSPTNPLFGFTIPGAGTLQRSGARDHRGVPTVQNQAATLTPTIYQTFRIMEGNPHGSAHVWVGGWMGSVPTAARDPLFFMLHCNVDRLWAAWQRQHGRFGSSTNDYSPLGQFPPTGAGAVARLGHYIEDTMWPWNGMTGFAIPGNSLTQRPSTAPGGAFPSPVPFSLGPPAQPRPIDVIDYLGRADTTRGLGFAYDDIPY